MKKAVLLIIAVPAKLCFAAKLLFATAYDYCMDRERLFENPIV